MTKLRAQMPARQDRARSVDLEAIGSRQGCRDPFGNPEVRLQPPRQRALRGLYQPLRITNQRAVVDGVEAVEQQLNVAQAIAGRLVPLVPDSQAEVLELAQHERRVNPRRVRQPDPASWPAMALPVAPR